MSRCQWRWPRGVGTQDVGGKGASGQPPLSAGPRAQPGHPPCQVQSLGPRDPPSIQRPTSDAGTDRKRLTPPLPGLCASRPPAQFPHSVPLGSHRHKGCGRGSHPPPCAGETPAEGPARGALGEAIPNGGSGAGSGAGSASRVVGAAGWPLQGLGQQATGSGHWPDDEGSAPPPGVTAGWPQSDHSTP